MDGEKSGGLGIDLDFSEVDGILTQSDLVFLGDTDCLEYDLISSESLYFVVEDACEPRNLGLIANFDDFFLVRFDLSSVAVYFERVI